MSVRVLESQDSKDQMGTVTSGDLQYPLRDEDLGRIVRYIQRKKRLPADLPAKVYWLDSETGLPKQLIPKEFVRNVHWPISATPPGLEAVKDIIDCVRTLMIL